MWSSLRKQQTLRHHEVEHKDSKDPRDRAAQSELTIT